MAESRLLRLVKILDYRSRSTNPGKTVIDPEPFQCLGAKMLEQATLRRISIKIPARPFRHHRTGQLCDILAELFNLSLEKLATSLRQQTFLGPQTDQLVENVAIAHLLHEKMPRRDIHPTDRRRLHTQTHRTKKVVLPGFEQHLIGKRPRRNNANHIALDHTLGVLCILDLFAHRHLVPGLDHLLKIIINGMIRQPRKRYRINTLAPARQRKTQNPRTRARILIKRLVKITHAKKQYRIRILFLKVMKLLHRRSKFFLLLSHCC